MTVNKFHFSGHNFWILNETLYSVSLFYSIYSLNFYSLLGWISFQEKCNTPDFLHKQNKDISNISHTNAHTHTHTHTHTLKMNAVHNNFEK
jgi:hypothetical protein